jgi:chromosome segregation ATPase
MEAATLSDQIPLIWRKDQALKELLEKKKISPEVHEDLHKSFEGVLNQLKSEAQTLMENVDKETTRCAQEIKELNYALVNLEIEHEIGKINEQSYQTSFATIQEYLKKTNTEKSELEATKSKLSNILLGETPPLTEQETKEEPTEESKTQEETQKGVPTSPTQSPNLPEPPVVVYVKEVGESSA